MHPAPLLVINLLSLVVLMLQFKVETALLILFLNALYCFKADLTAKKFFKIIITMPVLASSVFILNILYPADSAKLAVATDNWMRLSSISIVSVSAAVSLNFHKLLYYLMSTNKLRASIGYPILAGLTAIVLLNRESEKINMMIKVRKIGSRRALARPFLLLIFAIRHSQRCAISLVSRGLNDHKTYIHDYSVPAQDWRAILPFIFLIVTLETLSLMPFILKW